MSTSESLAQSSPQCGSGTVRALPARPDTAGRRRGHGLVSRLVKVTGSPVHDSNFASGWPPRVRGQAASGDR